MKLQKVRLFGGRADGLRLQVVGRQDIVVANGDLYVPNVQQITEPYFDEFGKEITRVGVQQDEEGYWCYILESKRR